MTNKHETGECLTCAPSDARRPDNDLPLSTTVARMNARRDMSGGPDACWPSRCSHKRFHMTKTTSTEERRAAWFLEHGSFPPLYRRIEVTCGNRKCLNPRHMVCPTYEERFWWNVKKGAPGECWVWTAQTKHRGYGAWRRPPSQGRGTVPAHRLAYEMHHGVRLTPEQFVCHACDNPPCVNPNHLWIGTAKDNHDDMVAKGRHPTIRHASERRAS